MVTVHGRYVQFRFYWPEAGSVHVIVDSDSQHGGLLRMLPTNHGEWLAVMKLAPGSYRVQYCADGRWFSDRSIMGGDSTDDVIRIQPDEKTEAEYAQSRGE